MRLFIAVNFNEDTKSALLDLRDELHASSEHGNFTSPENLHLTLAFLGECNPGELTVVRAVMDTVNFEPFDAMIEHVGRFGRGDGEALWFAGMREVKPLLDLQSELTGKLRAAGFELDRRKFSPHITLGRRVLTKAVPKRVEPFGETVYKIDLMKSERINGAMRYTSIYRRLSSAPEQTQT